MSKERILIVEDEMIIARDTQGKAEALGYEVADIAISGNEALEMAEKYRPDLILMDIIIKGKMDGIDTAAEIKKKLDIPIVFLTAHSDDNTIERAKLADSYGYIIKPIQGREFQIAIENALYKHQAEQIINRKEKWLTSVLNSISEAVIVFDSNGLIEFMNPYAESLTGWEQADAINQELSKVFRVDEKAGKESAQGLCLADMHHKNGTTALIQYKTDPILDENSETVGGVVVFRLTDDLG